MQNFSERFPGGFRTCIALTDPDDVKALARTAQTMPDDVAVEVLKHKKPDGIKLVASIYAGERAIYDEQNGLRHDEEINELDVRIAEEVMSRGGAVLRVYARDNEAWLQLADTAFPVQNSEDFEPPRDI